MARGKTKKEERKKNSGANLGFEEKLWQATDYMCPGNTTPTPISSLRGSTVRINSLRGARWRDTNL